MKCCDALVYLINVARRQQKRQSPKKQQQDQQNVYNLIQKYDTVTLLCHCKDEKLCHRSVVRDIIYSNLIYSNN